MDGRPHPETVIATRDLVKTFGRRAGAVTALAGVSLTVARGEVFGLLGRNGAGKTTLVKILLGLQQPTRGSARLFGLEPTADAAHRRVGYSPEEPSFPRHLTTRRALEMCGALSGLHGAALNATVVRQLDLAELTAVADRPVRTLSKGMAQRLSISQAVLHDPELLVLDEPTADLDPIARRQVRDLIVAFRQSGGTAIINSHLLSEIEQTCDRVAIMHRGRVHRESSLDALLAGGRELEDVFVEVVEAAGGGAGYAPTGATPA